MSSAGGAGALTSLKNKMQSLREEMDKSKDQYELKCKELESEQGLRSQVWQCNGCYPFAITEFMPSSKV